MGLEGLLFIPSEELVHAVIKESPVPIDEKSQLYLRTKTIREGIGEQVSGCLHCLDFNAAIDMTPVEFAGKNGTMSSFSENIWKCATPFRNADFSLYTRLVMEELYGRVARQPIVLEYSEVRAQNNKIIVYPLREPEPIRPTDGWVRSVAVEPSRD